MRLFNTFGATSACLALGLFAATTIASAKDIQLHVPVEAKWGNQVLPAGDYTVQTNQNTPFVRLSGNGKSVVVLAITSEPRSDHEHSFVEIVDVKGTPTVRGFESKSEGRFYTFAVSKHGDKAHNVSPEMPSGL